MQVGSYEHSGQIAMLLFSQSGPFAVSINIGENGKPRFRAEEDPIPL